MFDDLYPFLIYTENSEVMKEELTRQPSMIERMYGEFSVDYWCLCVHVHVQSKNSA